MESETVLEHSQKRLTESVNLIIQKHAYIFWAFEFSRLGSGISIGLLYDSLTYPTSIAFKINLTSILENLAIYINMRSANLQLALGV